MKILLLSFSAILCLGLWGPGPVEARQGSNTFLYFDSTFTPNPDVKTSAAFVPDPKATRVQVYLFKKSSVLWAQGGTSLPSLTPGRLPAGTVNLVKDPQLSKLIAKYAKQHGIDPRLVQAMVRQESGFNPMAVSPKGAMGLMQLMPETAASMGVEDPFDIEQNIKGGIRFFKICLNRFNQNLPLALAAYNAGPGRVVEHQGVPPFKETHTYVKNIVLAYSGQAVDPAQIKLIQPGQAQDAPESARPAEPSATPSVGPAPLNLTFFAPPGPEKFESPPTSEKTKIKKDAFLSIF